MSVSVSFFLVLRQRRGRRAMIPMCRRVCSRQLVAGTSLCAVQRAAAVLRTDLRELRAQCCALMASAIELEIQERRVKKARLDVEEEEINVRRMELALQRSKVEEQTEALQRSKIEEQAEALVSSPTETSSDGVQPGRAALGDPVGVASPSGASDSDARARVSSGSARVRLLACNAAVVRGYDHGGACRRRSLCRVRRWRRKMGRLVGAAPPRPVPTHVGLPEVRWPRRPLQGVEDYEGAAAGRAPVQGSTEAQATFQASVETAYQAWRRRRMGRVRRPQVVDCVISRFSWRRCLRPYVCASMCRSDCERLRVDYGV